MLHSIPGGRSPQTPIPAPTRDDLSYALEDTERMASILHTLLDERMINMGKGASFTVHGEDADDIRYAAGQVITLLKQAVKIWEVLP